MFLKKLGTGMFASNCYIIGDNGEGAIIDPGAKSQDIMDIIHQQRLTVKYIILTHAHIDHIVSMEELRQKLSAKVLVHKDDAKSLSDPLYNESALFGLRTVFNDADTLLKDGDTITVGGIKLEIIHTPGHTPGGICIKTGNCLFTGDTLFRMSIGRTDLGNGDGGMLSDSLQNKLMMLEDDTVVYPGHGASSTIGYERLNNPYV
jgi:glyoxylase-like metal-dependent hydrolase (beta-lactamase superfamily II)